jgi:hypothetical protein
LTLPEWNEDNKYLIDEFEEGIIYPAIMTYDLDEGSSAKIIALEESFSQWLNETDLLVDSDLSL